MIDRRGHPARYNRSLRPIQEVLEIRRFKDEGWTRIDGNRAALARTYGCSLETLDAIGNRAYWYWVEETPDSPYFLGD